MFNIFSIAKRRYLKAYTDEIINKNSAFILNYDFHFKNHAS